MENRWKIERNNAALNWNCQKHSEDHTDFIEMSDEVLNCPGGTATVENNLYFAVTGTPKLGGDYEDTITFNVESVPIA